MTFDYEAVAGLDGDFHPADCTPSRAHGIAALKPNLMHSNLRCGSLLPLCSRPLTSSHDAKRSDGKPPQSKVDVDHTAATLPPC